MVEDRRWVESVVVVFLATLYYISVGVSGLCCKYIYTHTCINVHGLHGPLAVQNVHQSFCCS